MHRDSRPGDRPTSLHIIMKTASSPTGHHPHSHSRSNSQCLRPGPRTPLASPRAASSNHGAGPPKLSPGRAAIAPAEMRASSPNYFDLNIEPADPRDSGVLPRDNWSPSSLSVRPFAAVIPDQVPLDANPEFEAFKRQVDSRAKSFGLALARDVSAATPAMAAPALGLIRQHMSKWGAYTGDHSGSSVPIAGHGAARPLGGLKERPPSKMDLDHANCDNLQDSAYIMGGDLKRNSEGTLLPSQAAAPASAIVSTANRFGSPARTVEMAEKKTVFSTAEDRDPRLSVMENRPEALPLAFMQPRPETVPAKLESGATMLAPAQLRYLIEQEDESRMLLLDMRSSQNFAQSRIRGALNLCIPTTLLKRATFDLAKLQQTFQSASDKQRFAGWPQTAHLVVYDAHTTEKRDAVTALNMIKKFAKEGYQGQTHILRGGFSIFQETYPDLITYPVFLPAPFSRSGSTGDPSLLQAAPALAAGLAPVIGGVMLPAALTANPANPFFANIRQNMDLADGVGRMEVARPAGLDMAALPSWLRDAAADEEKGKRVSDKFLHIEVEEQARMKKAYAAFAQTTASRTRESVQLSGVEMGGKNRYKDILPFEHARVKLKASEDGCDYVNASHLKAARTNKRYIATQGPLPATFEDFWSVIWDQDVRVIVMLTAESEGGQLKCHPYWQGKDYGHIRLKFLSEKRFSLDMDKHRFETTANSPSPQPSALDATNNRRRANTTTITAMLDVVSSATAQTASTPSIAPAPSVDTPYAVVRKFALSHAANPFAPIREITQIHYAGWPDFGAPAQPSHLLALVELANMMQKATIPAEMSAVAGSGNGSGGGVAAGHAFAGNRRESADRVFNTSSPSFDEPEGDARSRPMLVHCSAGCGRTGTFCTVDSVIDMLKRQRLSGAASAQADRHGDMMVGEEKERGEAQATDVTMTDADAGIDVDGDVVSSRTASFFSARPNAPPLPPLMPPQSSSLSCPPCRRRSSASTGTGLMSAASPGSQATPVQPLDTTWLRDDRVDLVERTVEDFREQRLSTVQSLRQYVLCYETVLEWMKRMQERGAGAGGGVRAATMRIRRRTGSAGIWN